MSHKRRAGVLMHISSLPGPYGIGVMGKPAEKFIDTLKEMDFRYWQVLLGFSLLFLQCFRRKYLSY